MGLIAIPHGVVPVVKVPLMGVRAPPEPMVKAETVSAATVCHVEVVAVGADRDPPRGCSGGEGAADGSEDPARADGEGRDGVAAPVCHVEVAAVGADRDPSRGCSGGEGAADGGEDPARDDGEGGDGVAVVVCHVEGGAPHRVQGHVSASHGEDCSAGAAGAASVSRRVPAAGKGAARLHEVSVVALHGNCCSLQVFVAVRGDGSPCCSVAVIGNRVGSGGTTRLSASENYRNK